MLSCYPATIMLSSCYHHDVPQNLETPAEKKRAVPRPGFSDYANWRNAWNQEKASYCCAQHGKGCGGPVWPGPE